MGAEPAPLQRKHSLSPLTPAPRAPVAALGEDESETVELGGLEGGIASSHFTPSKERDVTFSSVGRSGSGSADAIAATLAGYSCMIIIVTFRLFQYMAAREVSSTRCVDGTT